MIIKIDVIFIRKTPTIFITETHKNISQIKRGFFRNIRPIIVTSHIRGGQSPWTVP
jgi:hypothetical protein